MAFPTNAELTELIQPVVTARGLDVEKVKAAPAGRKSAVQIAVDADVRPTLDDLEEISNEISEVLDAAEDVGKANFGAGYTLEVSTPGVDMPLTAPRHWRRNRDRLVKIDGEKWRIGALSPDETSVILVGATKKNVTVRELEFSDEVKAVVEIEFNNPPQAELDVTRLTYDEAIAWREEHK